VQWKRGPVRREREACGEKLGGGVMVKGSREGGVREGSGVGVGGRGTLLDATRGLNPRCQFGVPRNV